MREEKSNTYLCFKISVKVKKVKGVLMGAARKSNGVEDLQAVFRLTSVSFSILTIGG